MSGPSPFERVYVVAVDVLPQLAPRNTSAIHGWLEAGCNPETDIIPTIKRLAAKNPTIGGFSYFTNAVLKARDERLASAERVVAKVDVHKRAKHIAWVRDNCPNIHIPQDLRWLEGYEAKYGPIVSGR